MANDMRWQMNCCIVCGGPIAPKKEVLRQDKVGSRSLLYLEEQVVRDGNEWGLAPNNEVHILSKQNVLHTVHVTNSMPMVSGFFNGRMQNLWRDDDTPGYAVAAAGGIVAGAPLNPAWIWIRAPDGRRGSKYRAVFWARPRNITGCAVLRDCIRQCLGRVNNVVRVPPSPIMVTRGCKECNDIMTQEGTMRHMLVRQVINPRPLVPLGSIFRYNLAGGDPNAANAANTINSAQFADPALNNISGLDFSYQATIAYFIHRCLEVQPLGGPTPQDRRAREFDVMFAFCLLMILCLLYERFYGKDGGTTLITKPVYRYRGLVEFYTSYIIYLLLSNDVAHEEPVNGRGIQMSFPIFHKYFFGEFLQMLVRFDTRYAAYTEISDVIYSATWFDGGVPGFVPAHAAGIARPAIVIGFLATRVTRFYKNIVRPFFSRHLAGLDPVPPVMPVPLGPAGVIQMRRYIMQVYSDKHLISRQNLDVFLHLCERASPGDIDSFMNHVGIHAVVRTWSEMLQTAPNKVDRILGQWVDAWTLYEYRHILKSLNSDPNQPSLPQRTSESIYLMCYALDAPAEPVSDRDIDALRECPKCSDYKAALRLEMAGAFGTDD